MNKYKLLLSWMILVILLGSAACKKSFYTDVNTNPNVPSSGSITPTVLLPSIEAALGYLQGGDMSRFTSLSYVRYRRTINIRIRRRISITSGGISTPAHWKIMRC